MTQKRSLLFICAFLLFFIQVSNGFAATDGHWGSQDFDGSRDVVFLGQSVRSLHEDLFKEEEALQKQAHDKGLISWKVNLVLGKITLFLENGGAHSISIADSSGSLVFDSAADEKKDDIKKAFGLRSGVDYERKYVRDLMKGSIDHSAGEFTHDVLNTEAGKEFKKKREDNSKDLRQSFIYRDSALGFLRTQEDNLLGTTVKSQVEKGNEEFKKRAEAFTKAVAAIPHKINTYIYHCCHSEPRFLLFLQRLLQSGSVCVDTDNILKVNGESSPLSSPVQAVLLNFHSTYDICNNCRLQIVGAIYHWLYKQVVKRFKGSKGEILFHTTVTWRLVYPGSTYKLLRDSARSEIDEVSSVDDTNKAVTDATKPFVSYIKFN